LGNVWVEGFDCFRHCKLIYQNRYLRG
jgi:hypothetical protein